MGSMGVLPGLTKSTEHLRKAILKLDIGFHMGTILPALLIVRKPDPCPFGFPEILAAAQMSLGVCFLERCCEP